MTSRKSKRYWRRVRRHRRRGRMPPATATELGTRSRKKGWVYTKRITRYHHYKNDWYFEGI